MSEVSDPLGADENPAELAAQAAMMRDVARAIENFLNGGGPKRNGFILFTFPFGGVPGNRVNYISNAGRADMAAMVREWLERQEQAGR